MRGSIVPVVGATLLALVGPLFTVAEAASRRGDPVLERLIELHKMLHSREEGKRSAARGELAAITDPRAATALWRVFWAEPVHHAGLAQAFTRIETPRTSVGLAAIAVYSPDGKAQKTALAALWSRRPIEFVPWLVNLLNRPLGYREIWVDQPVVGKTKTLVVEAEDYREELLYTVPAGPIFINYGGINRHNELPFFLTRTNYGREQAQEINAVVRREFREHADQRFENDRQTVVWLNQQIDGLNRQVLNVLQDLTGQNFRLDRNAWRRWLKSRDPSYIPPPPNDHVYMQNVVPPLYAPPSFPQPLIAVGF